MNSFEKKKSVTLTLIVERHMPIRALFMPVRMQLRENENWHSKNPLTISRSTSKFNIQTNPKWNVGGNWYWSLQQVDKTYEIKIQPLEGKKNIVIHEV